jgi:subtilase family serine protease
MIIQVTITGTSNLSPRSAVQSVVDLLTIQSNLPSQNYIYLPLVLNKPAPPADIDLVITDITVEPATPDSGQPATVYVTVKNQGTAAVKAGNNFFIDFYVDPATQPGSLQQGVLFWSVQGIDVAAGQSKTFSAAYTFGPGTHQLYGQADTDSTVYEINESNNVFGPQSITVTGSALQEAPTAPLDETPADPRPTPTPVP